MAAGTKKVVRKPKAAAAKPKPAAAAKSNGGKKRRTAEDVRKLVPQFVKHLTSGGKMKELKAEHGFSDDGPIRQALYLEGYDSKGNALPDEAHAEITATGKALATRLIKERSEGAPWYALAYRTGKSEAELRSIVTEAGGEVGRVYRKDPEKAAKKAAAGKKATAKKVAKKADPSKQA